MITAKELREISDRVRNRTDIEIIEDELLKRANLGINEHGKELNRSKQYVKKIAEYFRNNGLDVEYRLYGNEAYDNSPIYHITFKW